MWVIFYAFLLLTLSLAIINIKQNNMRGLSIITIVIIFTTPVIGIRNSIERKYGINEFEHLFSHIQQGSLWAIYLIKSYIYLLIWWFLFFFKKVVNRSG